MATSSNNASSGGIGLSGVLGVVFIVLKLTGVINWSWLWVTAPFWFPFVIIVVIFVILGILILAGKVANRSKRRA